MNAFKAINATAAFLLELAMCASYAAWGDSLGSNRFVHWLGAIVILAVIIALWAVFLAPRASFRLRGINLYLARTALLLGGFALLYALNHRGLAIILGVLTLVNQVVAFLYKQ